MASDNAKEELSTTQHRLIEGDKLWVEVNRKGISENPFNKGPEIIDVRGDFTAGDELFVKITSTNGNIGARIIHKSETDDDTVIPENNRESTVVWRGTEQDIGLEQAKKRSIVQNEGDVRGTKNDLLDGHL